jgi:hypothetical protein
MIVTTIYDHHLPSTGHIVQLFGSFHFKSTLEKDSKKQKVTATVAPISKIIPSHNSSATLSALGTRQSPALAL